MRVLMCFAFHPGGLGFYLERALAREHEVAYGGTPHAGSGRAGFGPDVDVTSLLKTLSPRADFVLHVDSGRPSLPLSLERSPVPTVGYLADVHLHPRAYLDRAPFFDYVFLTQKDYLSLFRQVNPRVYWLPFGADPQIHRRFPAEKIYDLGFVGRARAVPGRIQLLDRLSRRFQMNDYCRSYPPGEIAEVYCRAKIVFNKPAHGDLTLRPFEALSCGTLCLTERIGNGQGELFRDGEHLVEYGKDDDLLEMIQDLLSREAERERMAEAGHALVRSRHTYAHRVGEMLEILSATGWKTSAPVRRETEEKVRLRYLRLYAAMGLAESSAALWRQSPGPARRIRGFFPVLRALRNVLR